MAILILIRGFAATILFAWVLSWFCIGTLSIPLPDKTNISATIDQSGLMFQSGPQVFGPNVPDGIFAGTFELTAGNTQPWELTVSDINPVWLTRFAVYCRWDDDGPNRRFRAIGIRHSLLLFSAGVMVLFHAWLARRNTTQSQD